MFSKRSRLHRFVPSVAAAALLCPGAHQALAQGATDTAVKVGAYNALTGPIPLTGKQMAAGWNAAVQAVNAAGGVHGRKIELIMEDDGYEPSRAMAAARKLVERDKVLVVTGLGTPTTVVAARYLEQAKVPLLFPMGASSTQLNQAGLTQLFMAHPAYMTQAEIVIGWMMDNTDVKKPCILYQVDPSGEDHFVGAKKATAARKTQLAAAETFERGTTEFSAQVLKMKNAGCDFVYTATTLEAGARVVTAADRIGFTPKFAGFTTQADTTLIKLLGPLAEGFYAADMMARPESDSEAVKTYHANLKKYAPGIEPTFFTTYGYASMMLIAEAIRDAGPQPTRQKVIEALQSWNPKQSPLMGPVAFSPSNHDGKRSLYMIQVKDGNWTQVSGWIDAK
ncbi:MAG: ABC transporter substrate-binding protein [Ottowia sp.]|uniref:ABC transporter substrate-binding protein n=1 Tax=Ottowia sp. TaxID=1898956 RepID=UPI0039E4515C